MSEPYQPLDRLRARLEYEPDDLFEGPNAEARFDRLLYGSDLDDADVSPAWGGLEAESRGIIETRLGDEPLTRETDRVDELRPGDDAATLLVYPIQDVTQVEYKYRLGDDWTVLDADRYVHTEHRLILEYGRRGASNPRGGTRRNTLADKATRATWGDIAAKLRVTYDRGFETVPADIQSVQVAIVNRMLRNLKTEQNIAAMDPEEITAITDAEAIMTDDIITRIDQVTPLGGATLSV
jgi:hypothetical protein